MIHAEVEFNTGGAAIAVFSRDSDGKRIKQVERFQHYFYTPDEEGNYTTLFGEKCKKVPVYQFWKTKETVQLYDKTFESDLSYVNRFLADHGHKFQSEREPRKLFWDIETTELDWEEGQIISIVAYDSYEKEYHEFIWYPEHETCDSERKMLLEFAKFVRTIEPDVMSGWNCSKFDVPFLLGRMEVNNVPLGLLSPMGKVDRWVGIKGHEVIRFRGTALIDMLEAYQKMSYFELETYRLDYVAEQELGTGKNEISKLPGRIWEEGDYDTLLLYNKRDVEILRHLDEKLNIIQFLDTISEIASIDIQDTLHNSRIVDAYILKYTTSKGIILPSKDFTRKSSGYKGATVLEPDKGIHNQVGVFDLASLYPSIIISFNLSPETISARQRANTREGCADKPVGRGLGSVGLVPTLLEDLFTLRKEYRDQGLDNEQRVVKEIMNSFYGVMAFPSFRLYTPLMAEAITRHGREIIEHTKQVVEREGYKVIYGDTDSVFVSGLPNASVAQSLEHTLNASYNLYARDHGLTEHRLRIEFEKFATRAIMVGKKRYALKIGDDEYIIKGFQMVRSDAQQKTKDIQENIIHKILDGATNKDIREYFLAEKDKILRGNDLNGIAIPRKFTKALDEYAFNTSIEAAKFSNRNFKTNFGKGDKIVFYHIKYAPTGINNPDEPKEEDVPIAIAVEHGGKIPDGYIIDVKKHWERINKSIVPLLDEIGCLDPTKQKTLGDFFD